MSPLPAWVDLILFPVALASLFGYGFYFSDRLARLFSTSEANAPFNWGGEVERLVVAYGLGYGFLSLSMLGLGLLGCLYGPVIWSALTIGLFLCYRLVPRGTFSRMWEELRPSAGLENLLFGFLVLYFSFRFLGCLVPGWGYDEAMYHLTIPRQFLLAHEIHPTPNIIQANFPLNAQMVFLFLLGLGGEILCHLFQWAQYLVLGTILIRWARSLEDGAGYLAFLVYCSSTLGVYFKVPEEVHSDGPVALYFAISMLVFSSVLPKNRRVAVALAGILNGLAWGVKYTAFVFTTPLLLMYLLLHLRARGVSWVASGLTLSLLLVVSTLLFAPWMARGYAFTGNLVYPLLDKRFPSPPPYNNMAERLRDYEAYSNFYARDPALRGGNPFTLPVRAGWAAIQSLGSDKTAWAFQNGDYLLLLNLVVPFFGWFSSKTEIRRLAWTALVGNLSYLVVYGMHLSRFYSVVYPLAAVLFTSLLVAAGRRVDRTVALKAIISVFAVCHLCAWQFRWLRLQDWWGTPCLTQTAQRRFLVKRYAGMEAVAKDQGGWEKALRDLTPEDALILGHGIRLPLQSSRRIYYIGDFEEERLDQLFRELASGEEVAYQLQLEGFSHILLKKHDILPRIPSETWLLSYTRKIWENEQVELRELSKNAR